MTTYSHSKLTTFEQCRLKFKFSYVDKIKEDLPEGIALFLGKRVHEVFEKLYKELLKEKLNTVEELLGYYSEQWKKNWNDSVEMQEGFKEEHYFKLGQRYIKDYYARYHPFDNGRILGVETTDFMDLNDDYKYHVRIDLLIKKDSIYEIHDYKTYSSLPTQSRLDEDRQLALYSLWVRERFSDAKRVKLIWHVVAFDTEMVTEKSISELKVMKKEVLDVIHAIEKEKKFLPTVSRLCDWCEYQSICPEWKHKFKVDELPANKYLKEDGVVLVNKYASVYAEKKKVSEELEKELESLKEALIAYASREGVSTIFGSDKKISVKEYISVHVPAKGTAERSELEEVLHSLHKWAEVSGLDVHALKGKIDEWHADIKRKVEKYLEMETEHRISLGKKGEE